MGEYRINSCKTYRVKVFTPTIWKVLSNCLIYMPSIVGSVCPPSPPLALSLIPFVNLVLTTSLLNWVLLTKTGPVFPPMCGYNCLYLTRLLYHVNLLNIFVLVVANNFSLLLIFWFYVKYLLKQFLLCIKFRNIYLWGATLCPLNSRLHWKATYIRLLTKN